MNSQEVISQIKDKLENRIPMSPVWFLERAEELIILQSDEKDLLAQLKKKVATQKMLMISSGKSVAYARESVQTTEEWLEMKRQEARVEQIEDLIS